MMNVRQWSEKTTVTLYISTFLKIYPYLWYNNSRRFLYILCEKTESAIENTNVRIMLYTVDYRNINFN